MSLGFISGRAAIIGRVIDLNKKNAEILLHDEVPAQVLEQLVLDCRELLALLGDSIPVDLLIVFTMMSCISLYMGLRLMSHIIGYLESRAYLVCAQHCRLARVSYKNIILSTGSQTSSNIVKKCMHLLGKKL